MRIKWEHDSWITQLLYGESMLIEGRHAYVEQEVGFSQSFHWFCEEVECLRYEYKAREHAAAVCLGTAIDSDMVDLGEEWTKGRVIRRANSLGKKKQGVVKLKIRLRETCVGLVLAERVEKQSLGFTSQ